MFAFHIISNYQITDESIIISKSFGSQYDRQMVIQKRASKTFRTSNRPSSKSSDTRSFSKNAGPGPRPQSRRPFGARTRKSRFFKARKSN